MAIPPPKDVALLEEAYTPMLGAWQRHFVAFPVQPGPQACLIETKTLGGRLEIVDALTIVPCNVTFKHSSIPDPLYTCWLDVIAKYYKADIARLLKLWTFNPLAQTTEHQPPFLPVRHANLVEYAQRLFDELTAVSQSPPASVTAQTWAGFRGSLAASKYWYAQHVKMGEASEVCIDQWRIFSLWESWEGGLKKKPLTWKDRLNEYLKLYPRRPPKGKLRGRTNRVSNLPAAFKKRCEHMGLVRKAVPVQRRNQRYLRRFVTK